MENNEILTEQSLENSQISESEANQDEITFEDLGLDENTLKAIEKKGFKTGINKLKKQTGYKIKLTKGTKNKFQTTVRRLIE